MNRLSIKQLFYTLVIFTISIAVFYVVISSVYIVDVAEKKLHQESINRAYVVTKKLTAMQDRIAHNYMRHERKMYVALDEAQKYMKEFGRSASLDQLAERLNNNLDGIVYNIYIVSNKYIIENTTYEQDLGLDFHIIPEALETMKKGYTNPDYIDISSLRFDTTSNNYKRYIVQRADKGEYLIQLSMIIDESSTIENFNTTLSRSFPSLLSSNIYVIYPEEYNFNRIPIIWSQNYQNKTKLESLLSNDAIELISSQFYKDDIKDTKNIQKDITNYMLKNEYKDKYIRRDSMYVHSVLMPVYSYLSFNNETLYIVSLEFDESEGKQEIIQTRVINLFLWIVLIAIAIFEIILIKNRLIKPTIILQTNMKKKAFIDNALITKHNDEISSMMFSYNQLLGDLNREIITNEELLEQFKTFTGNAIHQIRTPISVIKVALEMIESPNDEAMLQIESSLVSIEHLYDSLAFTLQQDSIAFPSEELELSKLLEKRIEMFSVVASAHDKKIHAIVHSNIIVNMNRLEAEYLIDNNISNAIKYGEVTKDIYITLTSVGAEVMLSVANEGKEIEDKNIIFERYHRDDNSRRGSGIGLHIVQSICSRNKILIDVSYEDEKNKFTYFIPKK